MVENSQSSLLTVGSRAAVYINHDNLNQLNDVGVHFRSDSAIEVENSESLHNRNIDHIQTQTGIRSLIDRISNFFQSLVNSLSCKNIQSIDDNEFYIPSSRFDGKDNSSIQTHNNRDSSAVFNAFNPNAKVLLGTTAVAAVGTQAATETTDIANAIEQVDDALMAAEEIGDLVGNFDFWSCFEILNF